MALEPLATLEALGARLGVDFVDDHGNPTAPDGVRALAALEDASALIRAQAGLDWVDSHDQLFGVPDIVETICLAVALRAFSNPSSASQASVGDVSVSFSRGGDSGGIFLTNSELRAVRRLGGLSNIGSIQLETEFVPPGGGRDPLWAPTEGGGDPIPLGPVPWEV